MSAIFTEDVNKIRTINSEDMQNVVRVVKYIIKCENLGEQIVNMFDVELGEPNPDSFIDFNNLTKEQVLDWVKSSLGEQDIQERKDAMIKMTEQMAAAKTDGPQEVTPPWY